MQIVGINWSDEIHFKQLNPKNNVIMVMLKQKENQPKHIEYMANFMFGNLTYNSALLPVTLVGYDWT